MPPSPSIPRVEPTARLLCVCLPVGSPARALDSRASPRSAGGGVIMARFARWRASRWVGAAGLRDVASRTPPSDFFAVARRVIFCGYQKSRSAGFWPPQVAYSPALFPHRKTPTSQSKRPSSISSEPTPTSQPERPSPSSTEQNANLAAGAPKLLFLLCKTPTLQSERPSPPCIIPRTQ